MRRSAVAFAFSVALAVVGCGGGDGGGGAIPDDAYEPNDTRADAHALPVNTLLSADQGLGIEADDNDYYELTVAAGNTLLTVDCLFAHADGDLSVNLLNSTGTTLAASSSSTDDEQIVCNVGTAGTYYVYVYTSGASRGTEYDLRWQAAAGGSDLEVLSVSAAGALYDQLEAFDVSSQIDNNGPALSPAYDVSFYLSPDVTITAGVDTLIGGYTGAGLASAASDTRTTSVSAPDSVTPGAYYIGVIVTNAAETVPADNVGATAGTIVIDDDYEDNDSIASAYSLAVDTWLLADQGLALEADGADYYEIDVLDTDTELTIDCAFTHTDGNIDIELQEWDGTVVASSVGTADNEQIASFDVGPDGTYYVRVYSTGGSQANAYDLRWQAATPTGLSSDLGVDTVSVVSANYLPGDSVDVDTDIQNYGPDKCVSYFVDFYLSTDTTIDGADLYLDTYSDINLPDGVIDSSTTSVALPVDTDIGYYYVGIAVTGVGDAVTGNDDAVDGSVMITVDDDYEPNDGVGTAHPLAEDTWLTDAGDLGFQVDGADYYSVAVGSPDTVLTIDCSFTHSLGDIDISLQNSAGAPLAVADSVDDDEQIVHDVGSAGTYYVVVTRVIAEPANAYDLRWSAVAPCDLGVVSVSAPAGLHKPGDSISVTTEIMNYDTNTCDAYTVDFYASADTTIDAATDVWLGSYSDVLLAGLDTDLGSTSVQLPGTLPPGDYYVGIIVTNVGETDATDNDGYDAVPIGVDDVYEDNDAWDATPTALAVDTSLNAYQFDVDVYQITVGADTVVQIDCTFTNADGDIDIELLDSTGATITLSEGTGDSEQIIDDVAVSSIGAGTYYIRVYGPDAGNAYDLIWTATTPVNMNGFWYLSLDNVPTQGLSVACLMQDGAGGVSGIAADQAIIGTVTDFDTLNADVFPATSPPLSGTAAHTAPDTLEGLYDTDQPWTWMAHTPTGFYDQAPLGAATVPPATGVGVATIEDGGPGQVWMDVYYMTPTQVYGLRFGDVADDIALLPAFLGVPFDISPVPGGFSLQVEFQDTTLGGTVPMQVDHGTITFSKCDADGVAAIFVLWFDAAQTDGLTGSFSVPFWDVYLGNLLPPAP